MSSVDMESRIDGSADAPPDAPRAIVPKRTPVDLAYRSVGRGAGLLTFLVLFLIGLFLFIRAVPAFTTNGLKFFTTLSWNPDGVGNRAGVGAALFGSIQIAVIALVIALPLSVLTALFLTEFVPARLRRPLTSLVDLLAAIPSLIFGIWGFAFLQPRLVPIAAWITRHFGFIPIFHTTTTNLASSPFITGVVVSLMVLPVATSISREVFSRTPPGEKEAAYALGGTRVGMIRMVVLPFGRGGVIGGSMLGLGRALGETIAVAIIINQTFQINWHILQTGGNSIAALIANRFGDASEQHGIPALMAAGLVLFVITLLVNTAASFIINRSRSGAGVEI
jgi:phosphate transport system permease protein